VAEETTQLMSGTDVNLGPAERRLLAEMPLHAITSVHGEAGLRERLLIEIAQFPAADRGRATDALALASRLHAADRRQREPYASHLLRVTIRILSHYGVTDPDVACAALLHDAVEDHAADIAPSGDRQAALAVLAARFGARTAALVAAVTNPEWEPGHDEHEQYREHVLTSLAASPWAQVIKASDFTDNAVGIIHTTGPKLARLAGKYGPLVPALARAHPAPGHAAGERRQGHDRRPARRRPGSVRRDRARPPRRQRDQSVIRRPARLRLTRATQAGTDGRPAAVGTRFPVITATSPVTAVPPTPGVSRTEKRILVDLFDRQSRSQGGWMGLDKAGCAV
jgi:HD domain